MAIRIFTLGSAVLLTMALVCAAQQPGNEQQPPPGQPATEEQKPSQPPRGHSRPDREGGMLQMLVKELGLDEAQQAQVRAVLDEHRNREKELRTSTPIPADLQEKTAKVRDEMRKAREANDSNRLNQLREELQALQKEREEFLKPVKEKLDESQEMLHDQILATLRDDQKERFTELWDERLSGPTSYGGPIRNPRALKSQVDKLSDLTAEQKKQITALFDEFRRAARGPQTSGLKARKELAKKLHDDVFALLSPEQKEKLEKLLEGDRGPKAAGQHRSPKGQEGGQGRPPAEGGAAQPPPPPPPPGQ